MPLAGARRDGKDAGGPARGDRRRPWFCVSFALELAISDLQSQIERLTEALQRWQQAEHQIQPLEDRLSNLSQRGSEILDRLAAADERQAHAVSEVESKLIDWHAVERRLHQDSLDRIRALEQTIEQEWQGIRALHEEPLRQLREQAAALGETSMAAASLSLRGYERAEARLAAIEADLRTQLSQLSRDVRAALDDVKRAAAGGAAALPAPAAAPFPLDRVLRIHEELRDGAPAPPVAALPPAPAAPSDEPRQLPAALTARLDKIERELSQEKQDVQETVEKARGLRRDWRVGVALVVGALAVVGLLGYRLQQSLDDASERVAAAERQAMDADREIRSARAETTAAREAASRAELVSSILAAPDLLRFALAGVGDAGAARGHVMWSRSTGVVMSASTLPALPNGLEYHVWMLSPVAPTRVGAVGIDGSGRGTLIATNLVLPRPVNGVAVTLEAIGASGPVPSGTTVLARPSPAPGP